MIRVFFTCWLFLITGSSVAQTYACQFVASAGLNWEKGSWVTSTFKKRSPFFIGLNRDGKTIDEKTIANLVIASTCTAEENISCTGLLGQFLYFSPLTLKGAYVTTLGSVIHDDRQKDSLSISPFICQKM